MENGLEFRGVRTGNIVATDRVRNGNFPKCSQAPGHGVLATASGRITVVYLERFK